jgi:hypothetical protein
MKRADTPIAIVIVAALAGLSSACAPSIDFNSPTALAEGVRGKVWHAPYWVDQGLYTPAALSSNQLIRAFDAAVSGTQAQVVGTWRDQNQTDYAGFARRYVDGQGWIEAAPTQIISSAGVASMGFPTVAGGPGGLFAASFLGAAAGNSYSAYYGGGTWHAFSQSNASNYPTYDATDDLLNGPRIVTTMDSVGRGYSFYASGTANGLLRARGWQIANPGGLDAADTTVSAGISVRTASGLSARFDGTKYVCVSYEDAADELLKAACVDVTAGGTIDFNAATSVSISSTNVAGHETATDGAGNILAVYYQGTTSLHVYARFLSAGAASGSATRIDSAMDSTYLAPSSATIPGARPGVAYLGSGKYLAVWVGVDSSSTPKATQLYSAVYDPTTGWGAAAAISGTYDPYSATPHAQGLHVFSNGNGNAGYALNKIYTSQAIAPYTAATPDIYAETAKVRRLQVARWQTDTGWLTVTDLGNYCYKYTAASPNIADAQGLCSHRPTGVILPSGDTLVFFMDRDNYTAATSKGNFRLGVAEFSAPTE